MRTIIQGIVAFVQLRILALQPIRESTGSPQLFLTAYGHSLSRAGSGIET
jgi:hypothetical protein